MSIMLDESKPYGRTLGSETIFFKQGGHDFDSRKRLIPGSRNSAAALIGDLIEEKASAPAPVYEDMHIHALKRHADAVYVVLEENEIEFERVESGKGMQERLIEFLKANT